MTDKPSDDLRTRIAAVLDDEMFNRGAYTEYGTDGEPGQWYRVDGHINLTDLADAVIRELASDCATGCMWQIPNHFEDMTEQQRTILSAQRSIDEHNARDRGHWTEGEQ